MNGAPQSTGADRTERRYDPFLPLLVMFAAGAVWLIFQTVEMSSQRDALSQIYAKQSGTVEQAKQMRTRLQGLATGLRRLASSGDADAKLIIEGLRKNGININPGPDTPPPAR